VPRMTLPLLLACVALVASQDAFAADRRITPEERAHWAYQPPRATAPPRVQRDGWVRNPIDSFILSALEDQGLTPAPEANRLTLLRRLSFDLLGLPPTPAEIARFEADTRPDAYDRLVDRLLASPHYGERQAQHWLDLARYADSDGFEFDALRPDAIATGLWMP
jgi:hypothetical protein